MSYGRPTLSFSIDPKLPESAGYCFQIVQTLQNLRNRFLELPAMASQIFPFLIIRNFRILPSNASNCPKPSKPARGAASSGRPNLAFFIRPKLPDAPFKRSKPSETSNPALGGATKPATPSLGATKPWTIGGQVFSFLLTYLTSFKPVQIFRNLPNRLLELLGCGRPSLFFCTGPKLLDAPFKRFKPSETCETGSWSYILTGPKLPDAPFKRFKPSETFQTGSWSCQLWQASETCEAVLGAASCGRPSLSFSTGPKLPDASFKPSKPSETFQTGSWSCQLWQAKSFLF